MTCVIAAILGLSLQTASLAQAAVLDVRVAARSDDGEERPGGTVLLASSDLEAIQEFRRQTVGLRFNKLAIPKGATITNAHIQFTADEKSWGNCELKIQAQAANNAPAFVSKSRNISSRARTGAVVKWAPPPWETVGEAGVKQRTSNIARVIQEVVDRPGWSAGNSQVIVISGNGKRVAESFNGDRPGAAALLRIRYTDASGASHRLSRKVTAGRDDAEEGSGGWVSLGGNDLELTRITTNQALGLRFNNIDIPQGASISKAYIQFKTDEKSWKKTELKIQAEAVDNAQSFEKSKHNISSRPRTKATVTWAPPPWKIVGEAGVDQRTSNIAAVIQQIVQRPGWKAGNSQAILITGKGRRIAESFDGDPSGAPLLHIEYTTSSDKPPTPPGDDSQRLISQSNWKLVFADSEELVGENGAAINAFDGNNNTIWHTEWRAQDPVHPHEIQIDLGAVYLVDGFRYLPRQDTYANGRIGNYEFYVSMDGKQWTNPAASGSFANDRSSKSVSFAPVKGQFVRLIARDEANGKPWTSMAELNVSGTPAASDGGNNNPPLAIEDGVTVPQGGTANVLNSAAASVLANDTDPENGTLIAVLDRTTANGTLILNGDGTFSYTHNGGDTSTDSFSYHALDDAGNDSNSITVSIAVTPNDNQPPVAVTDSASVNKGATVTVLDSAANTVLANDSDPENGTLTAVLDRNTANGTLMFNGDGTFSYTHDGGDSSTDSFSYHARDDAGNDSNSVTVSIAVTPGANQPPVAVADSASVNKGATVTVLDSAANTVLANDSDPENGSLTAVLDNNAANGTLMLNADGTFSYTHDGGDSSTDSFSYHARDDAGADSSTVTVNLTISAPQPAALQTVRHLLNRTTFGATAQLVNDVQQMGIDAFLSQQLVPQSIADGEFEASIADFNPATVEELALYEVLHAVYSQRQLQEVMTWFWDNHFNTNVNKHDNVAYELDENRQFRANALGRFRDLLEISAKSPAMLVYLDGVDNVKADPNENYARELMELHTMGVNGGYTPDDVVAVARIFTGWTVVNEQFSFNAAEHDVDEKIALGQTFSANRGIEDGAQLLDVLATHPSTANFICTKLSMLLVSDTPPGTVVDQCAETFAATTDAPDQIAQVLNAILNAEAFSDPANYLGKIKTPLELVAGMARGFEAEGSHQDLVDALSNLGQVIFQYPVPTGESEVGADWINSSMLLERFKFVNSIAFNDPTGSGTFVNPVNFFTRQGETTAEDIVNFLFDLALGGEFTELEQNIALDVLSDNGTSTFDIQSPDADEKLRRLLGTVLSYPGYQFQ